MPRLPGAKSDKFLGGSNQVPFRFVKRENFLGEFLNAGKEQRGTARRCRGFAPFNFFTGADRGNRDLKTFSVVSVCSCQKVRMIEGRMSRERKPQVRTLAFRSVSLALPLVTRHSSLVLHIFVRAKTRALQGPSSRYKPRPCNSLPSRSYAASLSKSLSRHWRLPRSLNGNRTRHWLWFGA
jgi:hypothetical protein